MGTKRYWRANHESSAKMIELLEGWVKIKEQAGKLARKHGASSSNFYFMSSMGSMRITGFIFNDPAKVDQKLFVRVKGTTDGYRPRGGRKQSDLQREFSKLKSDAVVDIQKLIGYKTKFTFDERGIGVQSIGVHVAGDVVYIITPGDFDNAIGCERISDIEFEQATAKKPKAKSAKKKVKATP